MNFWNGFIRTLNSADAGGFVAMLLIAAIFILFAMGILIVGVELPGLISEWINRKRDTK